MANPARGTRGMAVAPHSLASQSALAVLRDGGNAIEAMIAATATISVVYPHMNGIGGDSFWLVRTPADGVIGIDFNLPDWANATTSFNSCRLPT